MAGAAEEPIWRPTAAGIARAQLTHFARTAEARAGAPLPDYAALHAWSLAEPAAFWREVWEFCGLIGERGDPTLVDGDRMPGARWFPEARLNFAENLLRGSGEGEALVFRDEAGRRRALSHDELGAGVARLAAALRARGVGRGERVAAILPNAPEAVVALLASASIGAVFSSCSPDFGVQGILDRFGQIGPRVLISADGYLHRGRRYDTLARLPDILRGLPSVTCSLVVDHTGERSPLPGSSVAFDDFVAGTDPGPPVFERLPFDHPLVVLYSSGTTGKPKCIVHGAGGTLLQHLKEHRLHVDLRKGERIFYFTTCGWMMWNWLASGLASEATLVLYDGAPFHPQPSALFDLAEEEGVDVFGVSAKFLDASAKAGVAPARTHRLDRLRAVLSTGSPLLPEGFDYVYRDVAPDVHLASISGGTDIVSCFVLGVPTEPVYRGEIQAAGLGMDVQVFSPAGARLTGEPGELVCTRPFPSMPTGFWNDPGGARYRAAYFERFPGVWCHGDWTVATARGGFSILGRSDTVLNPGGVRIGTAEIYRPVERFDEVVEALAIGQDREGDTRVLLFVVLRDGIALDDTLADRIRRRLREEASPRHVPARILQVPDLPRTRSGKISELAVRNVVHGRQVGNAEALANPEVLVHFETATRSAANSRNRSDTPAKDPEAG